MKKLVLTLAVIFGMAFGAMAQGGGLFGRGDTDAQKSGSDGPALPSHGQTTNQPAHPAPIGSGALLLIGFGAAYAMSKRDKE